MNLLSRLLLFIFLIATGTKSALAGSLFKTQFALHPSGATLPTIYFYNEDKQWVPFHKTLCQWMSDEEQEELTRYLNKLRPQKAIKDACEYANEHIAADYYPGPQDFQVLKSSLWGGQNLPEGKTA